MNSCHRNSGGNSMRNRIGILLLALLALFCTLAIKAAPQDQGSRGAKNASSGLPWAYGFATPFVAAPPPGGGGGGGGARGGAGAPAAGAPAVPAPAAEPEDRETPRRLPGAASAFPL